MRTALPFPFIMLLLHGIIHLKQQSYSTQQGLLFIVKSVCIMPVTVCLVVYVHFTKRVIFMTAKAF